MNHVYNQQSEGLNRYSLEDLVVKKCCDLHQKMQLTFPLMFLILLVWLVQASKLCIQFTWLSKSCDLQVIVTTQEDVITDQQFFFLITTR